MAKPFSSRELVARIQTVYKRSTEVKEVKNMKILTFGTIVLDVKTRIVMLAGVEIKLTKTEFELLE